MYWHLISFIVRLHVTYESLHSNASNRNEQLTIVAMFLPATIYMVIGVLGIGEWDVWYLLVTSTFNWLLGMRELSLSKIKPIK